MNIKVCGITQLKQLQQLEGLGIEFAGFVFVKDSPRYIGKKINTEDILRADFDLRKVGVFQDDDYETIMEAVEEYSLDVVQLHGDETPALCEELQEDVEVIKSFSLQAADTNIDELVADYDEVCDYYLFDTKTADGKTGGTGSQFDWNLITKARIEKPFFLSGGIGPDDAKKILALKHPDLYGVDINSRFEKEPGVKDMALILQFRQQLKNK